MLTLVYPLGRGRGQVLRWSLRSVHTAAAGRPVRIVLIGHVPDYIRPRAPGLEIIRVPQGRDTFTNVWTAWQKAADALDGRGEGWWWMNDDFFVTGALDAALTSAHLGPLRTWVDMIEGRGNYSAWVQRAECAYTVLTSAGYEPMSWETHRPMYVEPGDVYKARHFLAEARVEPCSIAQRTVIATVAGRDGPAWHDPKIGGRTGKVHTPLVSTSPTAWKGPFGRQLRARWLRRSPWER